MRGICACAMLGATLAMAPGARADDAAAAPAKPAPAAAETPPPAPKQTSPRPLFLKTTGIYLGRTMPADAKDGAAPPAALDLQLKPEDMQWLMSRIKYIPADEEPGTVEVTSEPDTRGPDIPGGPFALFWALKNPKQAWRIFTPVE